MYITKNWKHYFSQRTYQATSDVQLKRTFSCRMPDAGNFTSQDYECESEIDVTEVKRSLSPQQSVRDSKR